MEPERGGDRAVPRYFRACSEAIAEVVQASTTSRVYVSHTSVWQDFATKEGENIAVAFEWSDRASGISAKEHRYAPIIWCAAAAPDWPEWESVMVKLEAAPPEGWRIASRWYERPKVRRYLDEVVGTDTFDEQRSALAATCTQARDWLFSAKPSSAADPGPPRTGRTTAPEADPH